jgi:hypothetical protein
MSRGRDVVVPPPGVGFHSAIPLSTRFLGLQLRAQAASEQQAQHETAIAEPAERRASRVRAYQLTVLVPAAAATATNEHVGQFVQLLARGHYLDELIEY